MQTPAARYEPSPRPMPDKLPPLEYPDRFEVRYVSANGGIRWNKRWVNVSITVWANTSAWRKSTTACGMCTSGH